MPFFVDEIRANLLAKRGEIHSLRATLDMEYVHDRTAARDRDDDLSVMEVETEDWRRRASAVQRLLEAEG